MAAPRFAFAINARDSAARTGAIRTVRGEIRTPAFMPVGTAATLVGGRATVSWTPTARGQRSLSVRYSGDGRYAPSTSAAATFSPARLIMSFERSTK